MARRDAPQCARTRTPGATYLLSLALRVCRPAHPLASPPKASVSPSTGRLLRAGAPPMPPRRTPACTPPHGARGSTLSVPCMPVHTLAAPPDIGTPPTHGFTRERRPRAASGLAPRRGARFSRCIAPAPPATGHAPCVLGDAGHPPPHRAAHARCPAAPPAPRATLSLGAAQAATPPPPHAPCAFPASLSCRSRGGAARAPRSPQPGTPCTLRLHGAPRLRPCLHDDTAANPPWQAPRRAAHAHTHRRPPRAPTPCNTQRTRPS